MELEFYIPKLGLIPRCIRPVRPVADLRLYDLPGPHRFGMNFEETIVGKLTEVYQTVHLKEFTDFPKKDEKDPTKVFTDIHFKKKSVVAHEAYHLSHGFYQ